MKIHIYFPKGYETISWRAKIPEGNKLLLISEGNKLDIPDQNSLYYVYYIYFVMLCEERSNFSSICPSVESLDFIGFGF